MFYSYSASLINQLEIARKLTLVLAPIEEITHAISKQTVTMSMVIPFVRVLLRSWEKEDDDRGIQTMKEQMIHRLTSRFATRRASHLSSGLITCPVIPLWHK